LLVFILFILNRLNLKGYYPVQERLPIMAIEKLKLKLRKFAKERNWDQFHSPKNLTMALAGETGELLELFQWLKEEETQASRLSKSDLIRVKEEMADVYIYLILLADKLDVDLDKEADKKIKQNKKKYPVKLSKNNAVKYNRRNE
jgi:dCTP diphosphatase